MKKVLLFLLFVALIPLCLRAELAVNAGHYEIILVPTMYHIQTGWDGTHNRIDFWVTIDIPTRVWVPNAPVQLPSRPIVQKCGTPQLLR